MIFKNIFKKENLILKEIIRKDDLVFDVGANTGNKSYEFLKHETRVIGFEPQPLCAKYCRKRFANNSNFMLEEIGLDSVEGGSIIYESRASGLSSMSTEFINTVKKERFRKYTWENKITIKVDTLDNMIKKHGKPHFIKIDVEGYEYNVLKGLTIPIDIISIEYTPELVNNTLACIDYLESLNKNIIFNYGFRENTFFKYQKWISRNEIVSYLKSVKDYKFEFGDVYIKNNN